jgi:hypothetical protein
MTFDLFQILPYFFPWILNFIVWEYTKLDLINQLFVLDEEKLASNLWIIVQLLRLFDSVVMLFLFLMKLFIDEVLKLLYLMAIINSL